MNCILRLRRNATMRSYRRKTIWSSTRPIVEDEATDAQQAPLAKQGTSSYGIFAVALLLRLCISMLGYSGQGKAPAYGDFEAQRHWMEITTRLPVSQWYFDDPDWWRLDYPPLTAYHSWILGQFGSIVQSKWFDLYASRGCEELGLKIFMRFTVFASELLLYIPAVVLVVGQLSKFCAERGSTRNVRVTLLALLLQPAVILIDHGHFQYNTVMLGFFMAALSSFLADRHLLGGVFFVAALGFKQMALFYAPAIAAYLAGTCFVPAFRPMRLLAIAVVTTCSFVMLYAPILLGTWHNMASGIVMPSPTEGASQLLAILGSSQSELKPFADQIAQTLHRIFPFSRGVFEDKVANIWCSIHFSGLYKLAKHHSAEMLSLAALGTTTLLISPPCLIIFLRPRKRLITLAFTACAWGFFLCSYQVHEKNVMLPLIPMTALLAGPQGERAATRAWVGFANVVATWTLYHLLIKDKLQMAYWPLLGTWLYAMELPPFSLAPYRVEWKNGGPSRLAKCIHLSAYAAIATWHAMECFVPPPPSKPDLWIVANMICGCMAFCSCYLWCLSTLVEESGLLVDIPALLKMSFQERFFFESILVYVNSRESASRFRAG